MRSIHQMTPLHFDHRVAYLSSNKAISLAQQEVRAEGTFRRAQGPSGISARPCVCVRSWVSSPVWTVWSWSHGVGSDESHVTECRRSAAPRGCRRSAPAGTPTPRSRTDQWSAGRMRLPPATTQTHQQEDARCCQEAETSPLSLLGWSRLLLHLWRNPTSGWQLAQARGKGTAGWRGSKHRRGQIDSVGAAASGEVWR